MKMEFHGHLFVARHGQTVWNTEDKYQGQCDSPLTKKGFDQAIRLGEKLRHCNINFIISSPILRSLKTAEIVAGILNIKEITTMYDFEERYYGSFEGKTKTEAVKLFPKLAKKNITHSWSEAPPQAEMLVDFEKRVIQGLRKVKKDFYPANVLIITHAGVIRIVRKYFENLSRKEMFQRLPRNCELLHY